MTKLTLANFFAFFLLGTGHHQQVAGKLCKDFWVDKNCVKGNSGFCVLDCRENKGDQAVGICAYGHCFCYYECNDPPHYGDYFDPPFEPNKHD